MDHIATTVIDTLAKVRGRAKRRESSLYDDDYDALAGLSNKGNAGERG